ncbi:MAG: hypothetical protein ACYDGR_08045 [Candidatus Dormibacteria bacterium]
MKETLTVQRAIDLGWELADAHGDSLDSEETSPGEPAVGLPRRDELDRAWFFNLRARRISSGLELALGTPSLGLIGAGDHGPGQPAESHAEFRSRLLAAHHQVLEELSVRDPNLAMAYELGGVLAGIGLEPRRADPKERAKRAREALAGPRIAAARVLLDHLQPALPRHSARAVDRSLALWEEWMLLSASGVGWAGSTGERAVSLLHQQSQSWRMLLSGERPGEDVLGADARVAAAKRLGFELERLEVGHLRRFATWWTVAGVLVLGGLVGVGAETMGPIGASAILVLGCLSLYRVVTAGLPTVRARAVEALWEAQVVGALAAAITVLPGPAIEPISMPMDAALGPDDSEGYELPV